MYRKVYNKTKSVTWLVERKSEVKEKKGMKGKREIASTTIECGRKKEKEIRLRYDI